MRTATTPSTLYALTPTGVFQSTDNATTWTLTTGTGFPLPTIAAPWGASATLIADPFSASTLYFAPGTATVYLSANAGASWTTIGTGLPSKAGDTVVALIADVQNQGVLYAADANQNNFQTGNLIYKTSNHGAAWALVGKPFPSTITSLTADPEHTATLYVSTINNGYYVSKNAGITWTAGYSSYPFGLSPAVITVDPTSSTTLYAALSCQGFTCGIYKSIDGGVSFKPTAYASVNASAITIDPGNNANLYVSSSNSDTAFLAELNPAGSALLFSTYHGGVGDSMYHGLALTSTGNPIAVGFTDSSNFPTTKAGASPADAPVWSPKDVSLMRRSQAPHSRWRPDSSEGCSPWPECLGGAVAPGEATVVEFDLDTTDPISLKLLDQQFNALFRCLSARWVLTVTNLSNASKDAAQNVYLSWTKPEGYGEVIVSSSTFTCSGTSFVACNLSSLGPSAEAVVNISATAMQAGTFTDNSDVSASNSSNSPEDSNTENVPPETYDSMVVKLQNAKGAKDEFGAPVGLVATMFDCGGPKELPPTGTAQFNSGGTSLGSSPLNGSGVAQFQTSILPVGTDSITAVYPGDKNYAPVTSAALIVTITPATPKIALKSSTSTAATGATITFTATMTGVANFPPTGTVSFLDGKTSIGSGTLTAGVATFPTAKLAVGKHSITAVYAGDGNYLTVTSAAVIVTVTQATPAIALKSSVSTAASGATLTFTATMTGVPSVLPTGTVNFLDGTTLLGSGSLNSSGVATFATSKLTVGKHSVTAGYGGDANYLTVTSTPVAVTITAP